MATEYIVQTTLGFLRQDGGFSQEYPDAEIFTSRNKAIKGISKCPVNFNPGNVKVFKDYGLDTEESETI